MKIVLVNPPTNRIDMPPDLPLSVMALIPAVQAAGWEYELIDFNLRIKTDDRLKVAEAFFHAAAESIVETRPDMIGITCSSASLPFALEIARHCKRQQPDGTVLLGGPQASLLHCILLDRFAYVNMVCRGEGERTIEELLEQGGRPESIAGVTFRDETGVVVVNPDREPIRELDGLPRLDDAGIIDAAPYRRLLMDPSLPVETGRGCPYNCAYCAASVLWKGRCRVKSPERIVAEIESLAALAKIRRFHFIHDLFSMNRDWVLRLCRYLKALDTPVRWACDTRVDAVDEEMLAEMAAAGCEAVFFGLETGSPRTQKYMNKRVDLELMVDRVRTAGRLGIRPSCAFILGHPGESEKGLNESLNVMLVLKLLNIPIDIAVNQFTPEFGTAAFQACRKRLKFDPVMIERDLPFCTPEMMEMIAGDETVFSHFHYPEGPGYDLARLRRIIRLLPIVFMMDGLQPFMVYHVSGIRFFEELADALRSAVVRDGDGRDRYDPERFCELVLGFVERFGKRHGAKFRLSAADLRNFAQTASVAG